MQLRCREKFTSPSRFQITLCFQTLSFCSFLFSKAEKRTKNHGKAIEFTNFTALGNSKHALDTSLKLRMQLFLQSMSM